MKFIYEKDIASASLQKKGDIKKLIPYFMKTNLFVN